MNELIAALAIFGFGALAGWSFEVFQKCQAVCERENALRKRFCERASDQQVWSLFASLCLTDCECR